MSRADLYIRLLDSPRAPGPTGEHKSDDAIMQILVHMACADGIVQEEEFAFLERIKPNFDAQAILTWIAESAANPINLDQIAESLDSEEERRGALRFAMRLAYADRDLDSGEATLLSRLTLALAIPDNVASAILNDVFAKPNHNRSQSVKSAVRNVDLPMVSDALVSELQAVVPEHASPVASVVIDGEERVGLYDRGLVAHFLEGPAFLHWENITYYTRVPVFGAAVRVMTDDGKSWTIADRRLQEISSLLDRVYAPAS